MVWDRGLVSFFFMFLSNFSINWRDCSFPIVYVLLFGHKLIYLMHVCFFLDFLFCFIDIVSVFMPMPYYLDCYSFVIFWNQEVRCLWLCFPFSEFFAQWVFQVPYRNLIFIFPFVKSTIRILIRIALYLWIILASIDILTVLTLLIHGHRLSFLYLCILQFLLSMFYSCQYTDISALVKFIPKYIILFDATIIRIFSLISLSSSILLVWQCNILLYTFLYPAIFLIDWLI